MLVEAQGWETYIGIPLLKPGIVGILDWKEWVVGYKRDDTRDILVYGFWSKVWLSAISNDLNERRTPLCQ